jgi:ribosomal protein S18 acetylase RimI-like enzyme
MKQTNNATMTIREIAPADLEFAAACTAAEGWQSETRSELTYLFNFNRHGCLIGETETGPVGICFATSYGEVGFIGELIVAPEYRENGFGRMLMEHAIAYLRDTGARHILLDGVPQAVPMYERMGFRKLCRSLRFLKLSASDAPAGATPTSATDESPDWSGGVRPMTPADLASVNCLDYKAFGADRSFFISRRLRDNPELCFVQISDSTIAGYITGRAGDDVYSAGPWISRQGVETASALLTALGRAVGNQPLRIGILEDNVAAKECAVSLGFELQPNPCWRMVLGAHGYPESQELVFAVGSPAKG